MAGAMARGWKGEFEQMLFTDAGSGRAATLSRELEGEAVSNSEIGRRSDLVVLSVKPASLTEVASDLAEAKVVLSLLGATSLQEVAAALPTAETHRVMPNIAVEVQRGVLCLSGPPSPVVRKRLEKLGHVVELPDSEFDAATAVMGCAPAYLALAVEAIAEAGAEAGLDEELARSWSSRRPPGRRSCCASGTPPTCARPLPRPGAVPRPGSRRWSGRGAGRRSRRPCGPPWRGCRR